MSERATCVDSHAILSVCPGFQIQLFLVARILVFELLRCAFGITGTERVLELVDNRCIPSPIKFFSPAVRVNGYTISSTVGIGGVMQRLMDISDEMDQKGEI